MAGEKDAFAAPEVWGHGQTFHGALPLAHRSSSMRLVAQGVHGLPETAVEIGGKLALAGQAFHGLAFPEGGVAVDAVDDLGRQHEEAAVDPAAIACGFSLKLVIWSPFRLSAPKRPGGCVAVSVASLPCAR